MEPKIIKTEEPKKPAIPSCCNILDGVDLSQYNTDGKGLYWKGSIKAANNGASSDLAFMLSHK